MLIIKNITMKKVMINVIQIKKMLIIKIITMKKVMIKVIHI